MHDLTQCMLHTRGCRTKTTKVVHETESSTKPAPLADLRIELT
jgi:hypothetical protein